ncbi:hypothetical protein EDD18DRAFT_1103675 [Armillaria luteobubalina]|uniref:Uncharacterized protein n=1 Tax=Armillaria luteobubalina TaxID=153913 RepID=A0AA39QBH2_9AGAR|nr:hypothetical protein EDD18DRAFT_1103675 [Armillaria luteobubalina]
MSIEILISCAGAQIRHSKHVPNLAKVKGNEVNGAYQTSVSGAVGGYLVKPEKEETERGQSDEIELTSDDLADLAMRNAPETVRSPLASGHGEFCVRHHGRSDYPFPTTMKLPNEEHTLIFPGPDFNEDEWQEWFRAREEEDNVKKQAHGPVLKPWMISRKRKEVSEPGTAENSLQDGSAKVIGHPAK